MLLENAPLSWMQVQFWSKNGLQKLVISAANPIISTPRDRVLTVLGPESEENRF
jgi:hypothetical protein